MRKFEAFTPDELKAVTLSLEARRYELNKSNERGKNDSKLNTVNGLIEEIGTEYEMRENENGCPECGGQDSIHINHGVHECNACGFQYLETDAEAAKKWARNVINVYEMDMQDAKANGDMENAMQYVGRIEGIKTALYQFYGKTVNKGEQE